MGSSAARRPLAAVVPQRQFQQALRREQLTVHYQPIVALATQTISGVEALIRWQHPTGGLLPPADFLPAVAHSPVMRETTGWVLQRACRSTAGWPGWTVSVNVTAVDLTGPQLVRQVEDALAAASLPATRLVLELTEHSVVQDLATAVEVLSRLRELGVGVSLDDFGTGYSSLLYLRQLPVSQVKIDRVFVEGIADNDDDAAVVESVIHLAHAVGITAVAEGVERPDQLHLLKAMGCDAAQGFLFAKPAAEDAVVTTLAPTV